MNFRQEISNLLKNRLVIRHRGSGEQDGTEGECSLCSRKIKMLPGDLCLSVGSEGLLCQVCASVYAPEMADKLLEQLPVSEEDGTVGAGSDSSDGVSAERWNDLAAELNSLQEISTELAKGIARGIVEAPAGHIGLLHYAKDIQKPQRKEGESEKEYLLRVRTHRMTKLYEVISSETVERIRKIKQYLIQLGIPAKSA